MSELTNMIRAEFEGVSENGFPLHIFPQTIQPLLLDLKKYRGFPVEYTAMSMISAVATAVGNTYKLHVKSGWNTRMVFYMVLVGLPGACKTHPLNFAFSPLEEEDLHEYKLYEEKRKEYQVQQASMKGKKDANTMDSEEAPVCKRSILGDVTPEKLVQLHTNNKKGVTLKVDELLGLMKTVDQYSKGQFIETINTTWSGGTLKVDRCNNPVPLIIPSMLHSKKNGDNYVLLIVGCQSINDLSLRVKVHKSYVWHALPDSDEILDKTYQTNFYEMKWKSPRINLFLQQTR